MLRLVLSKCQKRFSLSKEERIRKKGDFLVVRKNGKRIETNNFIIYIHKNSFNINRIGIITSKIIGNAVKRNRVRRLLREFFRLNKWILGESLDFIFIAKKGAERLKYSQVYSELIKSLC